MKSRILLFLSLLTTLSICAQNEANHWYFGRNAGLDFGTNPATVLSDGALVNNNGCASISDATGALLFYTNGRVVFNRNHQIMLNGQGLAGDEASTQAALIIPKPLSDHLYYIFTTGSNGGFGTLNDGISYSVVDMNLDNGNGAIIEKNTFLRIAVSEKQKAVPHANGRDFWLVTHQYDSNAFYSFLVSCQGVQHEPVVSRVGQLHKEPGLGCCKGYAASGELTISKDYSKLAVVWNELTSFSLQANSTTARWRAEVFRFNNHTGKLSNATQL